VSSISGSKMSPYSSPTEQKSAMSVRKVSLESALRKTKSDNSKIGWLYICDCYPKTPKKFDIQEKLR
jgi:hypothetical protein